MIKKILIALDYNPSAKKVAEAGYAMAKAMNAEVTLLHVVADATYYSSVQYSPIMGLDNFGNADLLQLDTRDSVREVATDFLDKTREYLGDASVDILITEGECSESILQASKKLGADVIVLGTHSRRGLDKILMGSVAEKVLRHSDIPTYIIPTREKEN